MMQGADHISSTMKRCFLKARGILRIVNILEDFKNASPKIRSISIISYFKLNINRPYLPGFYFKCFV